MNMCKKIILPVLFTLLSSPLHGLSCEPTLFGPRWTLSEEMRFTNEVQMSDDELHKISVRFQICPEWGLVYDGHEITRLGFTNEDVTIGGVVFPSGSQVVGVLERHLNNAQKFGVAAIISKSHNVSVQTYREVIYFSRRDDIEVTKPGTPRRTGNPPPRASSRFRTDSWSRPRETEAERAERLRQNIRKGWANMFGGDAELPSSSRPTGQQPATTRQERTLSRESVRRVQRTLGKTEASELKTVTLREHESITTRFYLYEYPPEALSVPSKYIFSKFGSIGTLQEVIEIDGEEFPLRQGLVYGPYSTDRSGRISHYLVTQIRSYSAKAHVTVDPDGIVQRGEGNWGRVLPITIKGLSSDDISKSIDYDREIREYNGLAVPRRATDEATTPSRIGMESRPTGEATSEEEQQEEAPALVVLLADHPFGIPCFFFSVIALIVAANVWHDSMTGKFSSSQNRLVYQTRVWIRYFIVITPIIFVSSVVLVLIVNAYELDDGGFWPMYLGAGVVSLFFAWILKSISGYFGGVVGGDTEEARTSRVGVVVSSTTPKTGRDPGASDDWA